jgi:class 3 adenylate cyclase
MAKLDPKKRAKLPDSAFAYVDSKGRRRLPINDEPHVRNALARFNQVRFESDSAREKARKRLLNAARKFGIVPVGFITTQLEVERERGVRRGAARAARAATDDGPPLPTGFVTLLMTDIESSTVLLRKLGERYRQLLNDVRVILRETVARSAGREIDVRADEFFADFPDAPAAVRAAAEFQREIGRREWPDGLSVRVRAGIHSGDITSFEEKRKLSQPWRS